MGKRRGFLLEKKNSLQDQSKSRAFCDYWPGQTVEMLEIKNKEDHNPNKHAATIQAENRPESNPSSRDTEEQYRLYRYKSLTKLPL
jgi:hypothetical protein